MTHSEIAIVGAGLGGITAALLLNQAGFNVKLYEQTPGFSRIGAGIQLGPNVLKIMRRLGLEQKTEDMGSKPDAWISRNSSDGAIIADIPLNRRRADYGAAYVTLHRGDFHLMLADALPDGIIQHDRALVGIVPEAGKHRLTFANGTQATADAVVGADGVDSKVREILLGYEEPLFTGYVGHRAIFSAAPLLDQGYDLDACVKWWSRDRHMMIYYLDSSRTEYYYVTGAPEPSWQHGISFVPSSHDEMRATFSGYHSAVQAIIDASHTITKWPLLTRRPLPLWSRGGIALLGDACHPMKPHMAQGAAMAIEDAAILTRCLEQIGLARAEDAFELYRANRMERASRVQTVSNANTWLRSNENPDWVYGYDAYAAPLNGGVLL